MPEQASPFPGHVVGHVDGFLHIAAGFGQDFAHFAGHVFREIFLVLEEQLRGAKENFRALGRRDEAPLLVREVRGIYRQIHVLAVGGDKHSDQLVCVGRIAVLVGAAAARIHPLPIDEILVNTWCRCRGHTASWNAVLEL